MNPDRTSPDPDLLSPDRDRVFLGPERTPWNLMAAVTVQ
jgi:hypothetical protein